MCKLGDAQRMMRTCQKDTGVTLEELSDSGIRTGQMEQGHGFQEPIRRGFKTMANQV